MKVSTIGFMSAELFIEIVGSSEKLRQVLPLLGGLSLGICPHRHDGMVLDVGRFSSVKVSVTSTGGHSLQGLLIGNLAIIQLPKIVKDRLEVVRTGSVAFVLLHSPPISGIGHGCTKVRIDQRVSKGNIWMSRIFRGRWKGREKVIGDSHIANGTTNVCIRIRKVPVKKRIQTERRRRNAGRISRQRRRGIIRHH